MSGAQIEVTCSREKSVERNLNGMHGASNPQLKPNERPTKQETPDLSGVSYVWLVRDSNPRRLSRLIYSQIPLAAWVTSRLRFLGRDAKE